MLFALTVHQPYAHFLAAGIKRVENRDWRPPRSLIGKHLAIHAGRQYDVTGARNIEAELAIEVPGPAEVAHGAIIAVAVIDKIAESDHEAGYDEWYCGPVGWFLRDVVRIEPVPCRGYQKLWTVPPPELELVRSRYRAATVSGRGPTSETAA